MPRSRIADDLADEEQARVLAMTPEQRIALSLRLGAEAVLLYMEVHGVSRAEANRRLDAIARQGRKPCSWER